MYWEKDISLFQAKWNIVILRNRKEGLCPVPTGSISLFAPEQKSSADLKDLPQNRLELIC